MIVGLDAGIFMTAGLLVILVLPLVLTLFVAIHFWRIRKDGGLSRAEDADGLVRVVT